VKKLLGCVGSLAFAEACNRPSFGALATANTDFDLVKLFVEHCNALATLQERELMVVTLTHYVCQCARLVCVDKLGAWRLYSVERVVSVCAEAPSDHRNQIGTHEATLQVDLRRHGGLDNRLHCGQLFDSVEWDAGALADLAVSDVVVSTLSKLLCRDSSTSDHDSEMT
jgi:hypothetical protein